VECISCSTPCMLGWVEGHGHPHHGLLIETLPVIMVTRLADFQSEQCANSKCGTFSPPGTNKLFSFISPCLTSSEILPRHQIHSVVFFKFTTKVFAPWSSYFLFSHDLWPFAVCIRLIIPPQKSCETCLNCTAKSGLNAVCSRAGCCSRSLISRCRGRRHLVTLRQWSWTAAAAVAAAAAAVKSPSTLCRAFRHSRLKSVGCMVCWGHPRLNVRVPAAWLLHVLPKTCS